MNYDHDWRPRNFRDVGESLRSLGVDLIPAGRLYRGGEFDVLCDSQQIHCIGTPTTILNIRAKPDNTSVFPSTRFIHMPTKNGPRDYDTSSREVKTWIRDVLTQLSSLNAQDYPLFIHCRSGKDRTGIIVGILLILVGVPLEIVVQEYLLSKEGKISEQSIRAALDPFSTERKISAQCKKTNLQKIKQCLLAR